MRKSFLVIMMVLTFASVGHASSYSMGSLSTIQELNGKIDQLRDLILYSYQRSGLVLWAPFYYWVSKEHENKIFYCYTLLPLGRFDDMIGAKVNRQAGGCASGPVYVPVRINRAGGMRS